MPFPIRTPRVNNNDDAVRLSAILVQRGTEVRAGDPVCEVETDKATFSVETEHGGYLLQCLANVGDSVEVGSILAWIGDSASEAVPKQTSHQSQQTVEPTLKAALLLAQYGLKADQVPTAAGRLRAEDVEDYIRTHKVEPRSSAKTATPSMTAFPPPEVASNIEPLDMLERGMLRTVEWHRDEAVPGYVEIAYDPEPWELYAAAFQKEQRTLLSPLLGLLAYRLVKLCRTNPKLNATVHDGKKYLYRPVNLGFTIQSGSALYLAVLTSAEEMSEKDFVNKLADLQKQAMKGRLQPSQSSGATVGFTSMARWNVARHQPVLPPHVSFMVAHSATVQGLAAFGATYDHRLLTGADAVIALNSLKDPQGEI